MEIFTKPVTILLRSVSKSIFLANLISVVSLLFQNYRAEHRITNTEPKGEVMDSMSGLKRFNPLLIFVFTFIMVFSFFFYRYQLKEQQEEIKSLQVQLQNSYGEKSAHLIIGSLERSTANLSRATGMAQLVFRKRATGGPLQRKKVKKAR